MRSSLVLVFLGLVACGPDHGRGTLDKADLAVADLTGADLADEDLTGADFAGADLTYPYPAYSGPLTLPSKAQIEWSGPSTAAVQAAHFVDGRGTIKFKGATIPAIVYKKITFGSYDLAAIVGMTADNMVLAYAYCQNGGVVSFYYESLVDDDTVQNPLSSPGTCTFDAGPSPGMVTFTQPGTLAFGPARDHADIDGPRISLHGGGGTMTYGSDVYFLHVFATVDCKASVCGGLGWYELHTTLSHDDAFAIAILYLKPDKTSSVQVSYGFRFDQPSMWPQDEVLPATWTTK